MKITQAQLLSVGVQSLSDDMKADEPKGSAVIRLTTVSGGNLLSEVNLELEEIQAINTFAEAVIFKRLGAV